MRKKNNKAQSVVEMGVLLIVISAALIAIQTYLKRGLQGRLRAGVDSIGQQYDPAVSVSDSTISHASNITTNTTSGVQSVLIGQSCTGWGCTDVYRNVELVTSIVETHYDNTVKTGWENVPAP